MKPSITTLLTREMKLSEVRSTKIIAAKLQTKNIYE